VAVKVFRLDLTPDQTAALVAAFEQLLAKGLHHPAMSAPVATGLETGAAFLAQEYVVGESLDVLLRERGPLPFDETLNLVEARAGNSSRVRTYCWRESGVAPRTRE